MAPDYGRVHVRVRDREEAGASAVLQDKDNVHLNHLDQVQVLGLVRARTKAEGEEDTFSRPLSRHLRHAAVVVERRGANATQRGNVEVGGRMASAIRNANVDVDADDADEVEDASSVASEDESAIQCGSVMTIASTLLVSCQLLVDSPKHELWHVVSSLIGPRIDDRKRVPGRQKVSRLYLYKSVS